MLGKSIKTESFLHVSVLWTIKTTMINNCKMLSFHNQGIYLYVLKNFKKTTKEHQLWSLVFEPSQKSGHFFLFSWFLLFITWQTLSNTTLFLLNLIQNSSLNFLYHQNWDCQCCLGNLVNELFHHVTPVVLLTKGREGEK